MKLLKTSVDKLTRKLEADGLFVCDLHYKASDATGEMNYTGPKMPREMWQQILSFFKWSYDETKSEAQVRLFVSPRNGTWKAWAFPQQAEMGLATREISNDEAKKQRAELFEKDEEWSAWGTVHHHCSISAFQSGTDERDEKDVGGIHITVGDLDKAHYSIHCRLYHQGDLYEPDMSKLWDIGDVIERVPEELKCLMTEATPDRIARSQMCIPSSAAFPDQWKMNMIKIERKVKNHNLRDWSWEGKRTEEHYEVGAIQEINGTKWLKTTTGWTLVPDPADEPAHRRTKENLDPLPVRIAEALEALENSWIGYVGVAFSGGVATEELNETIIDLLQNGAGELVNVCKDYDLIPDDLLDELHRREVEEAKGQMGAENPSNLNNCMD